MSEPTLEHLQEIADVLTGHPIGSGYYGTAVGSTEAHEMAEVLLTSTDPAVLDAMQDALVRAGRLRVERQFVHAPFRQQRRLVADWQEVEPDA